LQWPWLLPKPYGTKATWLAGFSPSASSKPAVPLSELQAAILRLLASHRSPESYVAGASALNRRAPRYSADIDIFHDREEMVARAAEMDCALLTQQGYRATWLRREPGLHAATVFRDSDATRLEWARDSDYRFFPTLPDELFGYRLHMADLATNKALAAAGRREPRDILDLLYVHKRHLPLGAVIWAAVAKDPGYSPSSLIAEIGRNARYRADDFADLDTAEPVDAAQISKVFRAALEEAKSFVLAMPPGREGLIFLENGMPVQPDPKNLDGLAAHAGSRRGLWPSSPEIGSAMLRTDGI
jgi:hypothetical protein